MGIRRLASSLQPFADIVVLKDDDVVIDGPSFAYHIFRVCNAHFRPNSPFGQVSYALLERTAIQWLELVQSCGLTVKAIFFDGSLPPSKLPVRLERHVCSTKEHDAYHATHINGVPSSSTPDTPLSDVELFSQKLGSSSSKGTLLPPSFLVAAVLEALSSSESYGHVTHVVPGEADEYCAHHASRYGGTILTSDSDLILYDLGKNGGVAFFRNIELKDPGTPTQYLMAQKHLPALLNAKLGLPEPRGILRLAFESTVRQKVTLDQLIRIAKMQTATSPANDESFEAFCQEYQRPCSTWSDSPDRLMKTVPITDPRIAELINQLDVVSAREEYGNSESVLHVTMFLPHLLDCPLQSSGWEASAGVRQIGYGILRAIIHGEPFVVTEYRRLYSIPEGQKLKMPPASSSDGDLGAFRDLLAAIDRDVKLPSLQWAVLAIYLDISICLDRDRPLASSVSTLQKLAARRLESTSWGFLHLVAQIQATLYSCRMLQQILAFCLWRCQAGLPTHLVQVHQRLAGLPALSDFPSCNQLTNIVEDLKLRGGLCCLEQLFAEKAEVLMQLAAVSQVPKRRKKGKGSTSQEGSRAARLTKTSNNFFDVLAEADI